MTAKDIVDKLRPLGSEGYARILNNHGARDPVFGVKIEELKKIQKLVKKDYQLALDLFDTGIYDAMYLAGLIADDARMTKKDLHRWAKGAYCSPLGEYTVGWVAAGSPFGHELALEWIESKDERIAATGWSTLGGLLAITPDDGLDQGELATLLERIQTTIHDAPNRVRYTMNGFLIALGIYVEPLSAAAKRAAKEIGPVTVDMGGTACKTPFAPEYIAKAEKRGVIGKKRKTVKC
jgi:3-methyladenine DNA glycosylase AlkD